MNTRVRKLAIKIKLFPISAVRSTERIEALRKTTPPIVGVFIFSLCPSGAKKYIGCVACLFLAHRINFGIRYSVITNESTKAKEALTEI